MIAVLRRDDLHGVYFVTETDDPWEAAVQLCADHLFNIDVMVTLHADIDDVLARLENYQIRGSWHKCSLQQMFQACASICVDEPCDKEAFASINERTTNSDNSFFEDTNLPSCLTTCPASDAPLAAILRSDLVQLLGKEEARFVIKQLSSKTTRRGAQTCRQLYVHGLPVSLKD